MTSDAHQFRHTGAAVVIALVMHVDGVVVATVVFVVAVVVVVVIPTVSECVCDGKVGAGCFRQSDK